MPIKAIVFGGGDEISPQRRLAQFVRQIGALLHAAVFDEGSTYFYEDLLPGMRQAWEPVNGRIAAYAGQVTDAPLAALQAHGLTDEELDFKFAAVNFIAKRFFEAQGAPVRIARGWFARLLEILDKVLKSLIAAIPGGGAIDEYKGICESLVPREG